MSSVDLDKMDVFSRQALMFSSESYEIPVKIYGIWFIGSNLAYTLAKTGFKKIFLIDNDTVKEHNLLNQFYREVDLGKTKVEALKDNIEGQLKTLTGVNIIPLPFTLEETFEKGISVNNNEIVILSTDNKESRINFAKEIVKNWEVKGGYKDTIFLFVNTSGDVIYLGVNKGDKSFFETMITQLSALTEDDISVGLCGEKSSFYLGNLVSGYMISEVRKILSEQLWEYVKEALFGIKQNMFSYKFKWFSSIKPTPITTTRKYKEKEEWEKNLWTVYNIEEWNEATSQYSITDDDGSGYWEKDGRVSDDNAFNTPKLDATWVAWYNK